MYNLDGPGIRNDIYEKFNDETLRLANEKIISIMPQSSIVSRIMCNDIGKRKLFIKSISTNFLFQHDPITWVVNKDFYKNDSDKFVLESQRPESKLVEETLFNFLNRANKQDIKVFSDNVFRVAINNNLSLHHSNIVLLILSVVYKYAIQGKSVSQVFSIARSPLKAIMLNEEDKKSVTNVLEIMSEEFFKEYRKHFDEVNKSLEISKEVANQLKDYSGKNLSVSDVVKIGIKSYVMKFFKVYAIKVNLGK